MWNQFLDMLVFAVGKISGRTIDISDAVLIFAFICIACMVGTGVMIIIIAIQYSKQSSKKKGLGPKGSGRHFDEYEPDEIIEPPSVTDEQRALIKSSMPGFEIKPRTGESLKNARETEKIISKIDVNECYRRAIAQCREHPENAPTPEEIQKIQDMSNAAARRFKLESIIGKNNAFYFEIEKKAN